MSVIEDELLVRGELIDRRAALFALEEFQDLAVGSSEDGRFGGSRYIDGVMLSAFRSCVGIGVDQLIRTDTCNRDNQIHAADKIGGLWIRSRRLCRRKWSSDSDRSAGWKINCGHWRCRAKTAQDGHNRDDHQKRNTQQDSELPCPHGMTREQVAF